jgi:hypothetical protein
MACSYSLGEAECYPAKLKLTGRYLLTKRQFVRPTSVPVNSSRVDMPIGAKRHLQRELRPKQAAAKIIADYRFIAAFGDLSAKFESAKWVLLPRCWEIPDLLRLDIGRANHFAPLLRFIDNVFTELRSRTGEHRVAEFRHAHLECGIGNAGVDFSVKLFNDLIGCVLRYPDALPTWLLRSPARNRPQSGYRAERPSVWPRSPPERAACPHGRLLCGRFGLVLVKRLRTRNI